MVRQVVVGSVNTKVKHERRAGVLLLLQLGIGPATSICVWNHFGHGLREVCVDHHGVRTVFAGFGDDADGSTVFGDYAVHGFAKVDVDAEFFGDFSHPNGDASKSAHGVEDAVFVFEEGEDGEQRRAIERGHPEVLGLERHGQQQTIVVKQTSEVIGHAAGWAQDRRSAHGPL